MITGSQLLSHWLISQSVRKCLSRNWKNSRVTFPSAGAGPHRWMGFPIFFFKIPFYTPQPTLQTDSLRKQKVCLSHSYLCEIVFFSLSLSLSFILSFFLSFRNFRNFRNFLNFDDKSEMLHKTRIRAEELKSWTESITNWTFGGQKAAELKTATGQRPKSVTSLKKTGEKSTENGTSFRWNLVLTGWKNSNENTEVEVIPLRLTWTTNSRKSRVRGLTTTSFKWQDYLERLR